MKYMQHVGIYINRKMINLFNKTIISLIVVLSLFSFCGCQPHADINKMQKQTGEAVEGVPQNLADDFVSGVVSMDNGGLYFSAKMRKNYQMESTIGMLMANCILCLRDAISICSLIMVLFMHGNRKMNYTSQNSYIE